MSCVLSEYPETLPAPMVGVVTPTERRKVGSIGGVQSFRTVQRDRHGTRTYAFTFTKEQAAIFRDWWSEWEQRGGGWFAANWPLPWSRGPNVFRFKNPPEWSLIGGGVDGQGYWRVSGSVEIRGRGMLPTVEVMYLTSTPYPVIANDEIFSSVDAVIKQENLYIVLKPDSINTSCFAFISVRDTEKSEGISDDLDFYVASIIEARIPIKNTNFSDFVDISVYANISSESKLISFSNSDSLSLSVGATINAV